jgi:hypothetical protein
MDGGHTAAEDMVVEEMASEQMGAEVMAAGEMGPQGMASEDIGAVKMAAGDMDGRDKVHKDIDGKYTDDKSNHGNDTNENGKDNKDGAYIDIGGYLECKSIIYMTFKSENEAYKWYLDYGRRKGFGVRKDDLKYNGSKDNAYRQTFKCCKQGVRDIKYFQRPDQKRKPRPLSRCSCPALFQVELQKSTRVWIVKKFVEKHNHAFIDPDLTHYLSSHRKITPAQKANSIEYSVGGLRTH